MPDTESNHSALLAFFNSSDMKAFRAELASAPARAAAVLAVALIEDQLRQLLDIGTIRRPGVKRFAVDRQWAIADLSSLAYRMGLLNSRLHREIGTLASIRHRFAHRWDASLSWDHDDIKSLVGQLEYPKQYTPSDYVSDALAQPDPEIWWSGSVGAVIANLHQAQLFASPPTEVELD